MTTSAQKFLKLCFGLLLIGGAISYSLSETVRFESIESRTLNDTEVFNQVSYVAGSDEDLWLMKQSHHGEKLELSKWDELMIKVDKRQKPYRVSYHQFRKGKEVEYRVSCFFCHPNGPRAIRAQMESEKAPLSMVNKITLNLWNLRIKAYPKMVLKDNPLKETRKTPLIYLDKNALAPLKVGSCTMCHHDEFLGRGTLTRQQALPIAHLVASGQMPPWPFKMTTEDQEYIDNFLKGF